MAPQQSLENELSSKSSSKSSSPKLSLYFLTLFPEVFEPVLGASLLGKARDKNLVSFHVLQIRDFATDKHHTVDDTPFGGGEGMVMKLDVLFSAWEKARKEIAISRGGTEKVLTVFVSPQGKLFDQPMAHEMKSYTDLIFVCGHYEGVDERFIEICVDREVSIGDYVLTGGELPALVMADTIVRLLPGVVGNERSISEESLENNGLLKYPQYTRPREFQGHAVPDVLLAGDHKAIAKWRSSLMQIRTQKKRPDLWEKFKRASGLQS